MEVAAFADRCQRAADMLADGRRLAAALADDLAAAVDAAAQTAARADVGPDLAMSNWPGRPRLTVEVRPAPAGAAVDIRGRPAGPWKVADRGRRAGRSPRRRYAASRGLGTWRDTVNELQHTLARPAGDTVRRILADEVG